MKALTILTALLVTGSLTFAADKSSKPADGKHDAEAMFKKLDGNADASVGKEEFLASKKAQKDTDKASKHFEKLDANKDGKLSKEEFAAMEHRSKKTEAPAPVVKPEEKKPTEGDKPAAKPEEKK